MKVVLNQDTKNLGYRGDVVDVKPGYFRNFLFPRGIADLGTAARIELAESRKAKAGMKREQILENAKGVVSGLEGLKIVLTEKVNDQGHLYAAVSEREVADAIEAKTKLSIDSKMIQMDKHIKELGEYAVTVQIADQSAKVTVVVESV